MNPIYRTHRLSLTLAGLAAASLALSACQGPATTASYRPQHHATPAMAQHSQNGLTLTDLQDLAKVKRDLFRTRRRPPSRSPSQKPPPLEARNGRSAHVAKANPPSAPR